MLAAARKTSTDPNEAAKVLEVYKEYIGHTQGRVLFFGLLLRFERQISVK